MAEGHCNREISVERGGEAGAGLQVAGLVPSGRRSSCAIMEVIYEASLALSCESQPDSSPEMEEKEEESTRRGTKPEGNSLFRS